LLQVCGRQLKKNFSIALTTESYSGIYQCHPLKFFQYVPHFGSIRFEKIPACRNIEKQVLNQKGSTCRAGAWLLALYHGTFNHQMGT
jgi:hypothetical protein